MLTSDAAGRKPTADCDMIIKMLDFRETVSAGGKDSSSISLNSYFIEGQSFG
jgi:hypothetical protein